MPGFRRPRCADQTVADRGVQAALPEVVQLTHTLAQAEQSAAEWAARYAEETARVDELAKWNAALLDQIANLTSLLSACTGAQPPLLAEASTAAALAVRPPSTAEPPEESAVPHHDWQRLGLQNDCAWSMHGCTVLLVRAHPREGTAEYPKCARLVMTWHEPLHAACSLQRIA